VKIVPSFTLYVFLDRNSPATMTAPIAFVTILTAFTMAAIGPFTTALVISTSAEPVFCRKTTTWVAFIVNEFSSNAAIWVFNASVAMLMFCITKVENIIPEAKVIARASRIRVRY